MLSRALFLKRMAFAALSCAFIELRPPKLEAGEQGYWLREQLADVIYNISPEDSPFISAMTRRGRTVMVEFT